MSTTSPYVSSNYNSADYLNPQFVPKRLSEAKNGINSAFSETQLGNFLFSEHEELPLNGQVGNRILGNLTDVTIKHQNALLSLNERLSAVERKLDIQA